MIRTDAHRADRALRQRIGTTGQRPKLPLQLQRTRRKTVHTLAVRIQQKQSGIRRGGEHHLREMGLSKKIYIPIGREGVGQRGGILAARGDRLDATVRASGEVSVGMKDVKIVPAYRDRKSTRLNSSHQLISYAVFCLK